MNEAKLIDLCPSVPVYTRLRNLIWRSAFPGLPLQRDWEPTIDVLDRIDMDTLLGFGEKSKAILCAWRRSAKNADKHSTAAVDGSASAGNR